MKISVAMATYHGERHLLEQLDSIADQTRPPDELVVSDDASGDATIDILEAFKDSAPFPVHILHNDINLGYAGNFNRALQACSGDLVLPCDQDDVWFEEKVATMEQWAEHSAQTMVFACNAELTDAALKPSGHSKRGQMAALGLPESAFVMGCCLAIRKDYLNIALPIPSQATAHDNWLVELANWFDWVEHHSDILQYYRQHGSNVSDFAANTVHSVGPSQRMALWARGLVRRMRSNGGLPRELSTLTLQDDRVTERSHDLDLLAGRQRAARGIAALKSRLERLQARHAIRNAPAGKRPLSIIENWSTAGYRGRKGLLGALRDMIARGGET